jgi:hypothetical protein
MEIIEDYSELTPKKIQQISRLYNITPLGMGTPYIESLTSYIIRLSYLHCVTTGTLVKEVITPLLEKSYLSAIATRGGNGFYQSSNGINGIQSQAEDFYSVISNLTGVNVKNSTLLFLSDAFPTKGLLRKFKVWCPLCYEESKNKKEIPFDQLIWCFQDLLSCSIHRVKLETECPSCNKKQFYLYRKSRPGCCCFCGTWLGSENGRKMDRCDDIYNKLIEGMLTLHMNKSVLRELINKEDIINALSFYFESLFKGNFSVVSKKLGIPSTTLRYRLKGINRSPIGAILYICYELGLSVEEFLNKKPTSIGEINRTLTDSTNVKKKYDHEQIRLLLRSTLQNRVQKTVSSIAREIGCDRRLIYLTFPEECKQLRDMNKNLEMLQKEKRIERKLLELRDVVNKIIENGDYPSRRRVEEMTSSGFLNEKVLQNYWREIKEEII